METASVPVLAPVASIEDLSDGESPPGRMGDRDRLAAPGSKAGAGVAPPRIDISRASSSSHHDDSSPERELFAGGEGGGGVKLGLGFTEEMALELRSSTEELDFHGPPESTKYELEAQSEKERKDSACSDIGLLSISGRTSRLSSIGSGGSAASGVSGASHVSGGSHLSAASQLSKTSRCSSPHRTLLETSFCGPKPIPTLSLETDYPPGTESVEAALLARTTDPTGAVLPLEEVGNIINGIQTIQKAQQLTQKQETAEQVKPVQMQHQPPPKVVLHQTTIDLETETQTKPPKPKPKHKRRSRPKLADNNELTRIIPLHSEDSMETEDDAVGDGERGESDAEDRPYTPPENGIYIPLKGPDPILPPKKHEVERPVRRTESDRVRKLEPERTRKKEERSRKESKSERAKSKSARSPVTPQPIKPARQLDESELFKIIPLHGDTPPRQGSFETEEVPAARFVPWNEGNSLPSPQSTLSGRRSAEPEVGRSKPEVGRSEPEVSRSKPATLDLARLEVAKPGSGTLDLGRTSKSTGSMRDGSRTPSPAASLGRGSLFRRSSESSGSTKSRTSNSADSKTRKDSKNKSVFTSLFKKGGSGKERESTRRKSAESERHVSLDPKITNVEFTFSQDKKRQDTGPDAIVIPLHSPDSIAEPLMIYDPVSGKMISTRPEEELAEMQKQYQPKPVEEKVVEKVVVAQSLEQPPVKETRSKSAPPGGPPEGASPRSKDVPPPRRKEQPPSPPKRRFKETPAASAEAGKRDSAVSKTPSSADDSSSMTRTWSGAEGTIIVAADVITHSVAEEEQLPPPPPPQEAAEEEIHHPQQPLTPTTNTQTATDDVDMLQPVAAAKAPLLAATTGSDERKSSESEPDSDALPLPPHENGADDQEKKGLVHQPDSIEDELPYVPTTLPQERSLAHPMIPIKQRVSEVKTYPIERPRSTTPINPSTLDDYITPHDESSAACQWDKMQITLPRTDSIKSESRSRSPSSGKSRVRTPARAPPTPPPSPPPLPPRATAAWVSFEEVPERRRPPKRITTLPSSAPPSGHTHAHTVLSYVNPEECSCECHDVTHSGPPSRTGSRCHDITHTMTSSGKGGSCSAGTPRHRPDLPGVETLRRDKSKTRNYRT
ncbi:serine/arginine repetitive matrix protein 1 isoform X2 [Nilaparvata lugens]|uniref:serine/arginine repetitive matrix protein 1 isoform X2 n=2 Tax=Nilaparvata lugens TaxID=108931 RepID=UPI00193E3066|nr:serine/arginine repetitive matrix protein 1 isoform X2 [Nilaparvata lugens]